MGFPVIDRSGAPGGGPPAGRAGAADGAAGADGGAATVALGAAEAGAPGGRGPGGAAIGALGREVSPPGRLVMMLAPDGRLDASSAGVGTATGAVGPGATEVVVTTGGVVATTGAVGTTATGAATRTGGRTGATAVTGTLGIAAGAAEAGMVPMVRGGTGASICSTRAVAGIGTGAGSLDSPTTGALGASTTTGAVRTRSGARAGATASSTSTFLAPFLRGLSSSG